MTLSAAILIAAATTALMVAVPSAPSDTDVRRELVAYFDKNFFATDPSNGLQITYPVSTLQKTYTIEGGKFTGESTCLRDKKFVWTSAQAAAVLNICRGFEVDCAKTILRAIGGYNSNYRPLRSCPMLADELKGPAESWCSGITFDQIVLRGMTRYLAREWLIETQDRFYSTVQCVDGVNCFKVLLWLGASNSIVQDSRTVADVVQGIPECASALDKCTEIIQTFVDSNKGDTKWDCGRLAWKTDAGRQFCSRSAQFGWDPNYISPTAKAGRNGPQPKPIFL